MNRATLCLIMLVLILSAVGFEGLDGVAIALYELVRLCFYTSAWGKVVLFICGVLTVVFFIGE